MHLVMYEQLHSTLMFWMRKNSICFALNNFFNDDDTFC